MAPHSRQWRAVAAAAEWARSADSDSAWEAAVAEEAWAVAVVRDHYLCFML